MNKRGGGRNETTGKDRDRTEHSCLIHVVFYIHAGENKRENII